MMFSVRKVSLLVALASSCAAPLVTANSDVALDDLIVTGTRSETALLDLAGNTGRLSEAEIDLVRADHIEEIINRLPGVMVQRGNGQEHLTAIRSPVLNGGAGAGSFLFMQDGIPLRAAGFANANGLFEVNSEQAGSIEVVRGPGSALYGSNAVHGLVNVLTKAPSLNLEREIDVSAGPHDLYKFKGTVSNTIGAHGYRLSVNGTTDGGWIDDAGFDQQKMTFRHDYLGEVNSFQTTLSTNNLNQETAGYEVDDYEGQKSYKDVSKSKTNEDPQAFRDVKSVRLVTRWEHELNDDAYLSVTPFLRHTEMDFLMHFLPGNPLEKNEHDSVGLLTAFYQDLDGGHKLIVGLDLEYTQGEMSEIQTEADPLTGGGAGKYMPGTHYDYDTDATVIAPYIHTEWQLAERTRLTAGLRFEHTRYEYENKVSDGLMPTSRLFYRPSDSTDTFNEFSPKLGLVQALTEDTSAFINLARGNRAPQTTDLYRMRKDTNDTLTADSETVDSIEVGIRKVGAGIQYEATTFYMKKKDHFLRDSGDNNIPDGETKHYGIELSAFLPFADQFDLGGSFTYARHQYDFDNEVLNFRGDVDVNTSITDGDDIDTAPRHVANIRLGWNYRPKSRAELEWVHIGKYYTDSGNQHEYEGHDLLNLRVNYNVNKSLNLYGRVTNLTDSRYAERADFNAKAGGERYFVGEERALHVGASYSF